MKIGKIFNKFMRCVLQHSFCCFVNFSLRSKFIRWDPKWWKCVLLVCSTLGECSIIPKYFANSDPIIPVVCSLVFTVPSTFLVTFYLIKFAFVAEIFNTNPFSIAAIKMFSEILFTIIFLFRSQLDSTRCDTDNRL